MRAAALAAAIVGAAQGHGSLTYPPPRNNFGRVDPANRSIGNPVHGKWAHLPPSHINMAACAGGACLWFSEGCFIGCEECTATMPTGGQPDRPPAGRLQAARADAARGVPHVQPEEPLGQW